MAISGTNLSPDGLDESFVAECRKIYEKSPDPLTALMLNEPHIEPALLKDIFSTMFYISVIVSIISMIILIIAARPVGKLL